MTIRRLWRAAVRLIFPHVEAVLFVPINVGSNDIDIIAWSFHHKGLIPFPLFKQEVRDWNRENLQYMCGVGLMDEWGISRFSRDAFGDAIPLQIWFISQDDAMRFKMRWL